MTGKINGSALLDLRFLFVEMSPRKIRETDLIQISRQKKFFISVRKIFVKSPPRKVSKIMRTESVPKTDTGEQVEKTKANG